MGKVLGEETLVLLSRDRAARNFLFQRLGPGEHGSRGLAARGAATAA